MRCECSDECALRVERVVSVERGRAEVGRALPIGEGRQSARRIAPLLALKEASRTHKEDGRDLLELCHAGKTA